MSGWETKIFDNDFALDVKTDFVNLIGVGMSIEEIEDFIMQYQPQIDDDDSCAFWTALAKIEWDYGLLQENTKKKAQYVIKTFPDNHLYISEKDQEKRSQELEKLYLQLDTINEKPRKIRKTYVYRISWKVGDIFAYPLDNQYVYIHIVGIKRLKHRIDSLSKDEVFIKIFRKSSKELLDIKAFYSIFLLKYKRINTGQFEWSYIQRLWCTGKREQQRLEKKLTYIGNYPVKVKQHYLDSGVVCWNYSYDELENTLRKLFYLDK